MGRSLTQVEHDAFAAGATAAFTHFDIPEPGKEWVEGAFWRYLTRRRRAIVEAVNVAEKE